MEEKLKEYGKVMMDGKEVVVYEDTVNNSTEYVFYVDVPRFEGDPQPLRFKKRMPDCHMNQVYGREIVSDVSLVVDADLYPKSMAEMIARFEGVRTDGYYDGEYEEDFDPENDLVSPHEERAAEAIRRLNTKRQEQREANEALKDDVTIDMFDERKEATEEGAK